MVDALLRLDCVSKSFGGLQAVNEVTMAVQPASIHALIGPNGAGKTTTFNLVNGVQALSSGRIQFEGVDVTGWPVHRLAARGIARTFQTPRLFDDLSVIETVMCGAHLSGRVGPLGAMFRLGLKRREETRLIDEAERVLNRVDMANLAEERSRNLSYGYRRLLEVARALATRPKLLLLDEVAAGLNPTETARIAELVRALARDGMAVLLVEHDMTFVMSISERVTVLNFGSVLAEGTPQEVSRNPEVVEAYLGNWDED